MFLGVSWRRWRLRLQYTNCFANNTLEVSNICNWNDVAWKLVVLQTIAFSIQLHFTAFHAGAKAIRRSLPLDPRIFVT